MSAATRSAVAPRLATLSPAWRLGLLALLAAATITAFMTLGAQGNWSFVLTFRSGKLAAMLLVAYAIAVSSVLFQTVTHNRILTPSIMGFDALYVLIQSLLVLALGLGLASPGLNSPLKFLAEVALMTGMACLLFRWLFTGAAQSLHRMMLVGIIFGLLFRSLSSFIMRLIDPNEFMMLQDRLFASFNTIPTNLLGIAALALAAASLLAWRLLPRYDVLALGREIAINLGIDHQRTVMLTLMLIAVMVSVSTALVGPVTFFGLLVSNLAYRLMGSDRHRVTLPAAVLIAIIFLVGGQTLLERVLMFNATVSVVIEFVGGLLFIYLVTRKARR